MKFFKKRYLLVLLFIGLLFFIFDYVRTVRVQSDMVTFPTVGALVDKSDYIFVGEVNDAGIVWQDDAETVLTDYSVKVSEIIKDNQNEIKNDFTVAQFGGEFEGHKFVYEALEHPERNKRYLFFAMKSNNGHHYIWCQGQYIIDNDNQITFKEKKINLDDFLNTINDYLKDKNLNTEKFY